MHRPMLEAIGCKVVSRWHREQAAAALDGAMARHTAIENAEFARRDLSDVAAADILVLFTEPPETNWPRGARHVEYGYALALGKRCVLVGPCENVFHWLLSNSDIFSTVEDLAVSLKGAL